MNQIREAMPSDRDAIEAIYRDAFPGTEWRAVARVALDLLETPAATGCFALLAESDGAVAGHVAFSPVCIAGYRDWRGFILAPLAVRAAEQGRGLGSRLVRTGLDRLSDQGAQRVFVYGDPGYYGRFGFSADAAGGFRAPYPLEYAFGWQGLVLGDGESPDEEVGISCVEALNDPGLW
ncbi:MAG: GNAT family N-acetyltransferase [Gammaproteobacteria bacterium]